MILGSHNTLTYLDPKNKWLKPFTFMARCQNIPITDQYEVGARLFDFRIIFNKWAEPSIAHGIMEFSIYQENLENIFKWLDSKGENEDIWVRILNERDENYYIFIKFCEKLKHNYPHIKFFGGRNKKDWHQLYDFGYGDPNMIDKYASQNFDVFDRGTGWYWDDLWPWIYAKLHNKKWRKQCAGYDGYLMQDFVGVI